MDKAQDHLTSIEGFGATAYWICRKTVFTFIAGFTLLEGGGVFGPFGRNSKPEFL